MSTAGVALALAACAKGPVAPPPSPAGLAPSGDALRIVLVWEAPVDLDLYVTDPAMESVYFANRRSAAGGTLENDATCRPGARREVATWPTAVPGRYRVGLDFIDRCGGNVAEAAYRLIVDDAGRREERTGTVRLSRFLYRAFEFDIGRVEREDPAGRP